MPPSAQEFLRRPVYRRVIKYGMIQPKLCGFVLMVSDIDSTRLHSAEEVKAALPRWFSDALYAAYSSRKIGVDPKLPPTTQSTQTVLKMICFS